MADWIWCAATEKGINELSLDLFTGTVNPLDLDIKPITIWFQRLRETISRTLESEGFENDFITEAKFDIFISKKFREQKLLTCTATLKDKEGREYIGRTYTEQAYEDNLHVFKPTLLEKIKKVFIKINF
ncbi:hypothetical protein [Rufibacter tibetensis]|nr:hypothetical protein [Rufibacter tibetensis]